ncbi:hypothetical protein [Paludibaculum fermentans]|uniref:Uncharacterized protein n=1 Tax=Paludibaculum fermentans TaxID=1473598 RepID=A0A7S7NPX7_PALFE|nr:hypothetical protein [Paludibaculum fermentans]QOY87635.1 hypothetical protein IRI77_33600 [Paludibaculum fermentans]
MRKDSRPSRRALALILGLPAAPLSAAVQAAAADGQRQRLRQDGAELAKVKLPRECPPAFRFQP